MPPEQRCFSQDSRHYLKRWSTIAPLMNKRFLTKRFESAPLNLVPACQSLFPEKFRILLRAQSRLRDRAERLGSAGQGRSNSKRLYILRARRAEPRRTFPVEQAGQTNVEPLAADGTGCRAAPFQYRARTESIQTRPSPVRGGRRDANEEDD